MTDYFLYIVTIALLLLGEGIAAVCLILLALLGGFVAGEGDVHIWVFLLFMLIKKMFLSFDVGEEKDKR